MGGEADVLARLDVSRETSERLTKYATLLEKWNAKINLVSRATLTELWTRHILDSAQLFEMTAPKPHWVDLGSGGGFPGLVIACLAAEKAPDMRTTLIESDQRKTVFLRTVIRETGVAAEVIAERVEKALPQEADILSARALTNLAGLLGYAERHLKPGGTALFPKGVRWENEVAEAQLSWSFDYDPIKSRTDPGAVILRIKGATRV
jgi:16S rRNA (guanine527-N7)-methyltransferase